MTSSPGPQFVEVKSLGRSCSRDEQSMPNRRVLAAGGALRVLTTPIFRK